MFVGIRRMVELSDNVYPLGVVFLICLAVWSISGF